MPTTRSIEATPSNAGLLALEEQLSQVPKGAMALDEAAPPSDLLAATDGIAIAFDPALPRPDSDAARQQIERLLPRGWELEDEVFPIGGGETFRGLCALPPVEGTPAVGEAWALARTVAAVPGVRSAIPLFAQVSPSWRLRERGALGLGAAANEGPGDSVERREWHLKALKVPEAWQLSPARGDGVVVAVVDTGYTDHKEIFERLTKRPNQPSQVQGADLLDGQDPRDLLEGSPPFAFPGHGTSVASVIASPPGEPPGLPPNNEWLDGIAPRASVMPVRATTSVILLAPNKITPAVRQAVDDGADVINVSLGLPYYWPAFHAAIRYAVERGVIVVAASGNVWPSVVYPARFVEVLAAANCDWQLREWRWASSGETVDVLAPGVAVQCAAAERDNAGQISYLVYPSTGTTFASACCSALAALWVAHHGGRQKLIDKYQGQARRVPQAFHYLIRETARLLPDVPVGRYGVGLPQADALLAAQLPTPETLDQDAAGLRLHLAPLADAEGSALAGLEQGPVPADPELTARLRQLLGLPADGPLFKELQSEASFHLVSRPELWDELAAGRVGAVRGAMLASRQLSYDLRRQLEAATAAAAAVPAAAAAGTAFQPRTPPDPTTRSLQVYAFDPSLTGSLRTAEYNVVTVNIPWERLLPGPVGEYLEVVDVDPASEAVYEPVNLDDLRLLPSDGVTPDESDPWFHQQMVYAVAMKTIRHFEEALGRPAMWAVGRAKEGKEREPFFQRLRIYPHALRERNAYYSPEKRALLFGYFRSAGPGGASGGPMIFTCLSYDIIAHETAHALLDGMYHRYIEDTNPDMLAFHEAFADIVALFQHFTHPEVLRAAIGETRGDLELDSPLGKLAQQFGEATGQRGALRDAIGQVKDGRWQRRQPDPALLSQPDYRSSPHRRGSVLVAAVFDAFIKIYQRRSRSLIRLATGGSGVLPPGNIGADLGEALAKEAAKTAGQVLQLCIRALDYLPPVNITFGDYLRAVVTADRDLVPDDPLGYRVAIVEAFRAWGIQPEGVTTVAPESLIWSRPQGQAAEFVLSSQLLDQLNRLLPAWLANRSRKELHEGTVAAKIRFNEELRSRATPELQRAIGIDLARPFEVHTLRPAATIGPDGTTNPTVVVTLLQQKTAEGKPTIRTGATLLFRRGDGKIHYLIHKTDRRGQRAGELDKHLSLRRDASAMRDPYVVAVHTGEPFAALHLTGDL